MLTQKYDTLRRALARTLPPDRLITDELRTLAFGTDAGFYRLIPQLIVQVDSETEMSTLIRECRARQIPLTFRAAGTSLSGQAISDSVLALLHDGWKGWSIRDNGSFIDLQPGVIGAHANIVLAPYGRKIGPDPASINAAMIGGIAANNASGMCCGTAQNSYRTLESMRIIFADGTLLDTGDAASRESFRQSHHELLARLDSLGRRVRGNLPLAARIRKKYAMKNTTGYSLNALVDFEDPFEILQHLMIGSEGTLGFIARITYRTVPELPHKASSLMLFPDMRTACSAVTILKSSTVDAVELMDRASLRSVEGKAGMPVELARLGPAVASLLVETRAITHDTLDQQIFAIRESLRSVEMLAPPAFTNVTEEFTRLWNIRKGLFPSIGAMRNTGTTVIIEDVAFPLPELARAALDLQALFKKHRYDEAIIFGHALEGNLHFVFTQDFNSPPEVERYGRFIDEVTSMVVREYDGSLKAEHGTGRNMAPFVPLEWGTDAMEVMREIKAIFDPGNILNPGVILNDDPTVHLKNLKPLPAADPLVDKCIECGFCEVRCPSRALTLTPRQRIVAWREIARLKRSGENPVRLRAIEKDFVYEGEATCATDGLCALSCPVNIDTGALIKDVRKHTASPAAKAVAGFLADHMAMVTASMRIALNVVHGVHGVVGTKIMSWSSAALRFISGGRLPLWNQAMPRGARPIRTPHTTGRPRVVYFPTCINRSMGAPTGNGKHPDVAPLVLRLLEKAGYDVVLPPGCDDLCCGMAFASKGFTEQGDRKARELEAALLVASDGGTLPVLVDMSPCLYRMKETMTAPLRLYDPVRFALDFLVDRLDIRKLGETVAIHTTCSAEKMNLGEPLKKLAALCATNVVVPDGIGCCGWAGDRGFTYPELNASALRGLHDALPDACTHGYSTSRTCEIGLTVHSGIPYDSILALLDRASQGRGERENIIREGI